MSVDRMKQLQRNTVTNADVIDGALILKRYDGSKVTVEGGVELSTAVHGSKAIQIEEGGINLVLMASGTYEEAFVIGAGTIDDIESERGAVLQGDSTYFGVFAGGGGLEVHDDGHGLWTSAGSSTGRIDLDTRGVTIDPTSTSPSGHLVFMGLPTTDPHVVGAVWNNAGSLKISAG